MSDTQRWTPDEIRLAADSMRAAGRDTDGEVAEWLRPGFLSEEVAPMLDAFAELSASSVEPAARESDLYAAAKDYVDAKGANSPLSGHFFRILCDEVDKYYFRDARGPSVTEDTANG